MAINEVIEQSPEFKKLVQKGQRVCVKFKTNLTLNSLLEEVQISEYGKSLKVLISTKTRWFSEYLMFKRILENRDDMDGTIAAYADEKYEGEIKEFFLKSYVFTDEEYKLIKFFVSIFDTLFKFSTRLSSDSEPSMSEIIPSIKSILGFLNKEKEKCVNENESITIYEPSTVIGDDELVGFDQCDIVFEQNRRDVSFHYEDSTKELYEIKTGLIDNTIKSIEKYFIETNSLLSNEDCLISTLLNPKFKTMYFSNIQTDMAKQITKELISKLDQGNDLLLNSSRDDNNENNLFVYGIEREEQTQMDEVEKYINEARIGLNADLKTILSYWEINKCKYPHLYRLSRRYLCYIASSASSERLFSMSSNFFQKHRTRMLSSNLENECILKSFIDNNGIEELLDN